MSYNFETLGDERFQQLAQTLISSAFPNAQCLPVGQPDGGRDGFDFLNARNRKSGLIVFQVKYSRNPNSKNERSAVEELVHTESKKIAELKTRGATAYYLISNVAGTSHLGTGSIDKVNKQLSADFGISCYCWCRDDLVARVNANSDIKWSFPDIIKGSDVLQMLVEGAWKENAAARNQALKSYIASQFKEDEEVKFKQVELQNKILDLFVDLPVGRIGNSDRRAQWGAYIPRVGTPESIYEDSYIIDDDQVSYIHRRALPNAAELLSRGEKVGLTRVVLEGAPGQGKSTITQFLCQLNRLKLLGKSHELSLLPKGYKNSPVRVPFRIDLRDFAIWLSGRNPFAGEGMPNSVSSTSLESFISAQVRHSSGGQEFSVADLIAVAKAGFISIVLDGFDEVADIPTRRKVVEEITKAAARIQAHERSSQIIVTSRPAAFANSPGFAHDDWVHLEIQSMTSPQVDEYSKKWMSARRLPAREKAEFTALLKEKLEQPHMRDLARNPMQLTILLALIHTRGLSLPDKRTSLYDNYMELFFNRESEKSRVVREHRDLLIDIHRYLAWVLHTSAENGLSGGSISELDLKVLLQKYLESEGHGTELVEELFTGMVERVVALVSRVQGTFEFEVQPLREYFAARHLYETAPYSPPGSERKGTKPERFEALARNFYWLNVLRFFCGCFSRGELSSLSDGLEELSGEGSYRLIVHPRALSIMLLGDYVFSQQPLAVKRVVSAFFDQPGFKIYLAGVTPSASPSVSLPDRCGRSDVAEQAYVALSSIESEEDRSSIFSLIRDNSDLKTRYLRWSSGGAADQDVSVWLNDGRRLGLFQSLPENDVEALVSKYGNRMARPLSLAGRFDIINSNDDLFRETLDSFLDGRQSFAATTRANDRSTDIEQLFALLSPLQYRIMMSADRADNAKHAFMYTMMDYRQKATVAEKEAVPKSGMVAVVEAVVSGMHQKLNAELSNWYASLQPWKIVLGAGVEAFGPRWALKKLAVLAAGISSSEEGGSWSEGAWDGLGDVVSHMRYARLRSGNFKWWRNQLSLTLENQEQKMLLVLVILVWGTPRTLSALAGEISSILQKLDQSEWLIVYSGISELLWASDGARSQIAEQTVIPNSASPRLYLALGKRGKAEFAARVVKEKLWHYDGGDITILSFISEKAISIAMSEPEYWDDAIASVKRAYKKNGALFRLDGELLDMPEEIAERICGEAVHIPQALVRLAQKRVAMALGASAPKLGEVARLEQWFSQPSRSV